MKKSLFCLGIMISLLSCSKNDSNPVITGILRLSPDSVSVCVGGTAKVKATLYTSRDGVKDSSDITRLVSWSVDDCGTAEVSAGVVVGLKAGPTLVSASYGDVSCESPLPVSVSHSESLLISKSAASYVCPGDRLDTTATYYLVCEDDGGRIHAATEGSLYASHGRQFTYGVSVTGAELRGDFQYLVDREPSGELYDIHLMSIGAERNAPPFTLHFEK